MKTFTCSKTAKLSKFLLEEYGGKLSYSTFCKLLRNKDIKVDGRRVNLDLTLTAGMVVDCYYEPLKTKLKVLYKDENIVALFKGDDITSEDFYSLVCERYKTAKAVHRLDRNTSGIILYALNESAEKELLKAFKDRLIKKYYLAEVYGILKEKQAILTAYLKKDENLGLVKIYSKKVENSLTITTEYQVVKELENSSVVKILLHTGRTHQIRAHMAHIGHFVLGDGKYGDNKINKSFGYKRQRLCAVEVRFNFDNRSLLSYLNEITINAENKFYSK